MKKILLPLALIPVVHCVQAAGKAPADSVNALISELSIERKVAQLMVTTSDSRYGEARKAVEDKDVGEFQVGGIIIMGKPLVPALERANQLQELAEIPLLEFIDGEWGPSMRLTGFHPFPKQAALSRLPNDSLIYEMGRAIAREMKSIKVNVNFAPVLDINNNPDNIVIGERSFGADRDKVARYGAAYARGMQDEGIIACAKHFPGHGDTSVDSHSGIPKLGFSRERMESFELYPFRRAISEGIGMIMVGHLCAPALDGSGTPASISRPICTEILRDQMNFKGMIVCDALNMPSIIKYCGGHANAALEAYKAGADILLMSLRVEESVSLISAWIREKPEREADLDRRVRRVLEAKAAAGMLTEGYIKTTDTSNVDTEASVEFIAELEKACGVN